MVRPEHAVIAPSRRLGEACSVALPVGKGDPLPLAAEQVVRRGNPIHRQAGILIKQVLACLLVATPFALLVALRLGARHLDPQYTVLALGAVVVLVLLVIVPSVANSHEDTPHERNPERDAPGRARAGLPRDVQGPADLPCSESKRGLSERR
jgi:hypothetical protein